ncbi:MAG: hypothetical protein HYX74_06010 [Acidobacteria bacterium]|nr:hypothetical protein [Acidobacteriota bacterium]
MPSNIDRREFLVVTAGGIFQLGRRLQAQGAPASASGMPRIVAAFSYGKGVYYFNPAGLHVAPGQTVQWAGVGRRAVIAYHPSIDNHELRIPESAKPFDSRTAATQDGTFTWKFEVEGTYDYYSPREEYLGMVGRIVVGKPGGPAEKPPGYGNREGRAVMYPDAARVFQYLKPDEIVQNKSIPFPLDLLERKFPWR